MLVIRLRKRDRDEAGAIAVIVAVGSVLLFVIAALVVDLGLARDTRRQSQNAADASALAAANVLYPGTACTALNPNGTKTPPCYGDAVAAAKRYAADNFAVGDADWTGCTDADHYWVPSGAPQCISFTDATLASTQPANPTQVRVIVPVREVKTGLGSVTGVASVRVSAAAVAGVDKAAVGGLRPWGICSGVTNVTGNVTFVPMYGGSTSTHDSTDLCGDERPPGGWWVMRCTGQGNANGATDQAVRDGCPTTSYHAVPGQPTTGPGDLYDALTDACPKKTRNDTCLASDPGNNFHNSSEEWQTLVGQTFTMPVMCGATTCEHLASAGTGQNASYAIYRLATVVLCGFRMKPKAASTDWPTKGPCATNNPQGYTSNDVLTGAGFFLVITAITGDPAGDWELPGQVGPASLVK